MACIKLHRVTPLSSNFWLTLEPYNDAVPITDVY